MFSHARENWLAYFTEVDCFCVVLVVYLSDSSFEIPAGAFASGIFHKNAIEQKIASSKRTGEIQVDCGEFVAGNRTLVPHGIVRKKLVGILPSHHESNSVDMSVPPDHG